MVRIVIQHLLLFLLPTVMYGFYLSWARRRAQAAGRTAPVWQEGPWFWLIVSGALLVLLSLGALATFGGGGPDAVYKPSTIEDGKIVHGRTRD